MIFDPPGNGNNGRDPYWVVNGNIPDLMDPVTGNKIATWDYAFKKIWFHGMGYYYRNPKNPGDGVWDFSPHAKPYAEPFKGTTS